MKKNNRQKYKKESGQPFVPKLSLVEPIDMVSIAHDQKNSTIRYKIPITMENKISVIVRNFLKKLNLSLGFYSFREKGDFIPFEYKTILKYLHKNKITQTTYPLFDKIYNDEPKIYAIRLVAKNPETDGHNITYNGGYSRGVSLNFNEAISKVIGELLERYPLTIYKKNNLVRASIRDLKNIGKNFLNPGLTDYFSKEQKQEWLNKNFDEDSIFSFVEGKSLTKNCKALIPAQMVFWNFIPSEREPLIQQTITNGAGGMFSYEEAILSGLYELIQRDAFLIYWLNKITPRKVLNSSVNDEHFKKLLESCERYNIEVHILDVTSDLNIPVFVCVLVDRTGKGPAISLGGGCGYNQEITIRRAITEAVGVRNWMRNQDWDSNIQDYQPFSVEMNQIKRFIFWNDIKNLEKIEFFISANPEPVDIKRDRVFSSPKEELDTILKIFSSLGDEYEVFAYEAKHKILDDLGYNSVSVSVPALVPLYLVESFAPLGAKRIKTVPHLMGKEHSAEIYHYPHPFP